MVTGIARAIGNLEKREQGMEKDFKDTVEKNVENTELFLRRKPKWGSEGQMWYHFE